MNILGDKPPYSRNEIKRLSSALRHGDEHDEEVFDRFMAQQVRVIESLNPIIRENFLVSLLLEPASHYMELIPDGGKYLFTSRPKTKSTTVEKLHRLKSYPLDGLHDTAGLRIDFDGRLSDQTAFAHQIATILTSFGANKVEISDLRSTPHSGYRAMHIIAQFPAGRAEIQVRTSLQGMWANVFELAADIYGREIRYEGWQDKASGMVIEFVEYLHSISDQIYDHELEKDQSMRRLQLNSGNQSCTRDRLDDIASEGRSLFEQLATIKAHLEHIHTQERSQQ